MQRKVRLDQYPSIDMEKFATRLRNACKAKNVSVRELKDFLNLGSVQAVYLWLNGKRLPSLDNLYALSKYLEIPMDVLIGNERRDMIIDILANDNLPKHGKRVLIYWNQLHHDD